MERDEYVDEGGLARGEGQQDDRGARLLSVDVEAGVEVVDIRNLLVRLVGDPTVPHETRCEQATG